MTVTSSSFGEIDSVIVCGRVLMVIKVYRSSTFNLKEIAMLFHLLASTMIFNLIAYFIPKKLTKQEIYATSLFALVYQLLVDTLLDPIFNLYGYFTVGVDIITIIPVLGIYPSSSLIYLNYYPFLGSALKKALYILSWSLFALFFEWTAIMAGWFYHDEWKLVYSAVSYPIIFFILTMNLSFYRKLGN